MRPWLHARVIQVQSGMRIDALEVGTERPVPMVPLDDLTMAVAGSLGLWLGLGEKRMLVKRVRVVPWVER